MTDAAGGDARFIDVNGVRLHVETFGKSDDPMVLLIGGATATMRVWDAEFCRRLADGGRLVVRYDQRDTGESTAYPLGSPGYDFTDLIADAAALPRALGADRAHVVGASLGGGIGQRLALEHPALVASLTVAASSPGMRPNSAPDPDLPPMSAELQRRFGSGPPPTPTHNHWVIDGGPSYRDRLGQITAPTLVIQGTEDPLFPFGHAQALAREVPGSRLIPMAGVGHEPPPRQTWDEIVPALLEHTDRP
ncbi:alpha/beta fold hydrolase [Catellatospora sp. KI3]|uniref:alpha/beta fold hydrolase n=1 Tax=Catellatospora sp. KI3 TaxID=3041620 RepID=UPI0024828EB9|nr:alpha/beta fold hydrolase [Catellatospora sp. KI3]MDI1461463.1 alpha/beta fold hydrolase [Catellatospora sp. KI3]